jgi:Ca2+-binding EF-hand superfamily protein
MYSTSTSEFTKGHFARAVRAVAGVTLSPLQVDVIFTVFDRDGDGSLDFHELVTTLKARTDKGMGAPRDLGVSRVFNCCMACIRGQ